MHSYKEQTVFEPFSPKTNVIVGRNGSGKSNFFAAIRFVLSDAYTQMGREERQALLHEGSGSAVMSAYVEVIFDNSDERFPTGKPELVLRRTIGLKKDEYSLDRKSATKSDVMNLLESAGFSRSNPYYIVPQGRVTTLTNMKDPERLNLLKEVAGTQVYENKRADSLKVMTETNNKRSGIDDTLNSIKDRLEELEEEKEELRGYQEKDKDRRCLEYAYFFKEQEAVNAAIEDLEQFRSEGLEGTDENRQHFMNGEKSISDLETEIKKLTREIDLLKLERKQLEEDRRDTSRTTAKLELNVKTLTQGLSASEQTRAQHQQELKAVKAEIAKKEAELKKLTPQYAKSRAKENEIKQHLDQAEGDRTRLYNKQGRSSQYKNRAERDKYLNQELEDVRTKIGEQKANKIQIDEEVESVQDSIKSLEGDIAQLRERFDGWGGQRQILANEVTAAKDTLSRLREERKILRREEETLNSSINNARQEELKADRDLSHTMDNQTSRGLATVRRLKAEQKLDGAYGTLAELFEVDENYRTAAEQTAGNSLFHYVVDTEATAAKLVEALYKNKGGRVTFMPLNRLTPRAVKLPKAADAQGLQSKLHYDKKYEKAMAQVFGKTVVCPSLTVAAQYARSHGCNAITPDGDTANKKGAMTGGYIDSRISRLRAVRELNKARDEYESLVAQQAEIAKQVQQKDVAITDAMSKETKATQAQNRFENDYDPLRGELSAKNQQLSKLREQFENDVQRKETIQRLQNDMDATRNALEAEVASDFKKSLTANEEAKLEQLHSSIQDFQKQLREISQERRDLEMRKQGLEIDLRETLRLKLDQLNSQEIDSTSEGSSSSLTAAQKDLARIRKSAEATEKRLGGIESRVEQGERKVTELQKTMAELVENQQELARNIEKQQKRMEKSVAKKALLATSAAETAKNIRDLGVLPEEAFEKYVNHDSKSVSRSTSCPIIILTFCRSKRDLPRSMRLSKNTNTSTKKPSSSTTISPLDEMISSSVAKSWTTRSKLSRT